MGKHFIYTQESLAKAAAASVSIMGVVQALGLTWNGGRHQTVRAKLVLFGIDTSHFQGRAANSGANRRGGNQKRQPAEVLVVLPTKRRERALRLRRALIESGRLYCCALCNGGAEWMGKELRLSVDHINGDWCDCRSENLRFLCPNCHAQTPTYCHNHGGTSVVSDAHYYRQYRKNKSKQALLGELAEPPA